VGVLAKYLPVLFVPAFLVELWRTRQGMGRLALTVGLALAVGLGIGLVLYGPLWMGTRTFQGILERGHAISSASPFGAINWLLRRSPLQAWAGPLTAALVTLPVLAFIIWISLRVTDAASLARACAWISVAYLLAASPDYWPWYTCLPVALLAAGYLDRLLWVVLLLSLCSRLAAPFNVLFVNGLLSMRVAKGLTTGIGATLPLLVLGGWALASWRSARLPQRS
jgi:hypothetical protein